MSIVDLSACGIYNKWSSIHVDCEMLTVDPLNLGFPKFFLVELAIMSN